MRRSQLFSAFLAVLVTPALAGAEGQSGATETAPAAGQDLSWEQFEDPAFNPTAADAPSAADAGAAVGTSVDDRTGMLATRGTNSVSDATGIVLGPAGVDDQGRSGRLHTVAKGDTLWFISAAYLGTPWVWPSVWTDNNDDIDNPHLILPNDKIWITANEMRVVSDAEAEAFLSAAPAAPDTSDFAPAEDFAAAFDGESDEPSSLDAFPVSVTAQTTTSLGAGDRSPSVAEMRWAS